MPARCMVEAHLNGLVMETQDRRAMGKAEKQEKMLSLHTPRGRAPPTEPNTGEEDAGAGGAGAEAAGAGAGPCPGYCA